MLSSTKWCEKLSSYVILLRFWELLTFFGWSWSWRTWGRNGNNLKNIVIVLLEKNTSHCCFDSVIIKYKIQKAFWLQIKIQKL